MLNSRQIIAGITSSVINNAGSIAPTAALVKLEQRKYTDERANTKKHCGQLLKAQVKLDSVADLNPPEIVEELPTNISDDVRKNQRRTQWQRCAAEEITTIPGMHNWRILENSDTRHTR